MVGQLLTALIRVFSVSLIMSSSFVTLGFAQSPKLDEVSCMRLAAAIVGQTGAQFDRRSPSGANIFIRHPAMNSLTLSCDRGLFNMTVDKPIPSREFYEILDRTSTIMFASRPGQGRSLAQSCHKKALDRKSSLMAEVEDALLSIDCNVVLRAEGAVFMGISARGN